MKQFRTLVDYLRAAAPPLLPVRAYLRRMAKEDPLLGYATLVHDKNGKPDHFTICVHKGATWPYLRMVLLHEWAHCLAWHDGHETVEDHGAEWAVSFGRIYQLAVEL